MTLRLYELDYGIASRIGDDIYINKKLKKDIGLYYAILNHEIDHSSGYTWKDISIDISNPHLSNLKLRYYKFLLSHPSTWTEFIPFAYRDNQLVINPTMLIVYIIFTVLILLGCFVWR